LVNPLYIYPGPDHTGAKYLSFEGKEKKRGGTNRSSILLNPVLLSIIYLLASLSNMNPNRCAKGEMEIFGNQNVQPNNH
jgi:hypothetical protein